MGLTQGGRAHRTLRAPSKLPAGDEVAFLIARSLTNLTGLFLAAQIERAAPTPDFPDPAGFRLAGWYKAAVQSSHPLQSSMLDLV